MSGRFALCATIADDDRAAEADDGHKGQNDDRLQHFNGHGRKALYEESERTARISTTQVKIHEKAGLGRRGPSRLPTARDRQCFRDR
jgi:hypothetical protein